MQKQALNKINSLVSRIYSAIEPNHELIKILSGDEQYLLSKMQKNSILKQILGKCISINCWVSFSAQRQRNAIEDSFILINKMQEQIIAINQKKGKEKSQYKQNLGNLEQYLDNVVLNIHNMSFLRSNKYKSVQKSQNTSASNMKVLSQQQHKNVVIERDQLLQQNIKLTRKIQCLELKRKLIQSKLIQLLKQHKIITKEQNFESRIIDKIYLSRSDFYSPSRFDRNISIENLEHENKYLRNYIQKIRQASYIVRKEFQNQKRFLLRQIQKLENQIFAQKRIPAFPNKNIFQVVDNIQMQIQDIRSERLQNEQILDRVEQKLSDLKLIKRKKSAENLTEKFKRYQKSPNNFEKDDKFKSGTPQNYKQLIGKKDENLINEKWGKYKKSRTKSNLIWDDKQFKNYSPTEIKIKSPTNIQSSDKFLKPNKKQVCQNPEAQYIFAKSQSNEIVRKIENNNKYTKRHLPIKNQFQPEQELQTSGYFIRLMNDQENNSFTEINFRSSNLQFQNLYPIKSYNNLPNSIQ